MTALMDYIRVTTTRLNVEVDSLDSLRYVMVVLKEVRERESSIEMEITPILDMYQMLEHYLPGGLVDKVGALVVVRRELAVWYETRSSMHMCTRYGSTTSLVPL